MSRLDDLIQEFCPDGVEYKTLSEIFDTRNGYTPSKSNKENWTNGEIPWFVMEDIRKSGNILSNSIHHVSKQGVKGNLFPENSIIVATSATIGEHALITVPSLANQRFTYLMLKEEFKEQFDIKFLYYYCYKLDEWCLNHLNQGSFASVDMKQFVKFTFPLPALPVQREIVRILDEFTLLSAELAAELAARQKQYEYYRDTLLNNNAEIPKIKLGEFAVISRGGNFQKKDFVDNGLPCIHYGQIYTHYGTYADTTLTTINEEAYSKSKKAKKNDIVMAVTSENIEDVCKSVAWLGDKDIAVSGHTAIISHQQNAKYLSYYFSSNAFFKQKKKLAHGTKVIEVTPNTLANIEVPLPSLEVQNRLVEVLDNFDSICSDLNIGLPAEIEARQKQYEFYRDQLLTFAENGNTILTNNEQRTTNNEQRTTNNEQRRNLIKLLQYVFGYANVSLSDIAEYQKERIDASLLDASTYVGVDNLLQNKAGIKKSEYVPTEGRLTNYHKGDVLIGNIRPYLRKIWLAKNDGGTNGDVLDIAIKNNQIVTSKFLYYVLSSESFFEYDMQYAKGAKMPRGDKKAVMNYTFTIPTIKRQKEIVAILDKFDALCNDLSTGIPAEIEANQKRYEYYRDQLLTFDQKI